MKKPDLKVLLEQVLTDFPPALRTKADPVQFPRWFYEHKRPVAEIEAAAVFAAMLAYGSAAQFIKKINQVMQACDHHFLRLITTTEEDKFVWPTYRLSTGSEIGMFARAVGRVITSRGGLKRVFLDGYAPEKSIQKGLTSLQRAIIDEVNACCPVIPRGVRHLLPDPSAGGCAKRWHMFLRWMVRPADGVDMGLWQEVDPGLLLIPLDRHISRIARNLGLTTRNTDDWKTAEEIAARLKDFSPTDPIKYDFALCHLGIAGECTHGKNLELCKKCLLAPACRAANSHKFNCGKDQR